MGHGPWATRLPLRSTRTARFWHEGTAVSEGYLCPLAHSFVESLGLEPVCTNYSAVFSCLLQTEPGPADLPVNLAGY